MGRSVAGPAQVRSVPGCQRLRTQRGKDLVLAQHEMLLAVDLQLGAGVFPEQDLVADVERDRCGMTTLDQADDDPPIQIIDDPYLVQRYIDEGFVEFPDYRRVEFDEVPFTLRLIG